MLVYICRGRESILFANSIADCNAVEVKPIAPPAVRVFVAPRHALAPFVPGARGRAERAAQALGESAKVTVDANKKGTRAARAPSSPTVLCSVPRPRPAPSPP